MRSAQPPEGCHDRLRWDADTAVEQLYAAHYRRLVRLSVLLVRDLETAEEVVQDSFVAMHGRWRTAARAREGPGLPPADGRQPVALGAAAPRRPGEVRRPAGRPTGPDATPGADEDAVAAERRAAVLDAMRTLPDRQREVLALRYYLDLSEAEIASTLGISRGRREEPFLARRRRPAHPDGGPRMNDDQLRALLEDAVSDVEPRGSLDEIRSRTTTTHHRRPWAWGAGGAVLATAATIAAIAVLSGGPGTTDAEPGPAVATQPTGPQTSATERPSQTVTGYYVVQTKRGALLYPESYAVVGEAQVEQAVERAVTGQADDPTTARPGRPARPCRRRSSRTACCRSTSAGSRRPARRDVVRAGGARARPGGPLGAERVPLAAARDLPARRPADAHAARPRHRPAGARRVRRDAVSRAGGHALGRRHGRQPVHRSRVAPPPSRPTSSGS